VAVNVTSWPAVDGLAEEDTVVVVAAAGAGQEMTTCGVPVVSVVIEVPVAPEAQKLDPAPPLPAPQQESPPAPPP
jgi:hypothetical protein